MIVPVTFKSPLTTKVEPLKVRFCSPFKLVPVPPVITLLSALLLIVAEPDGPGGPGDP